MLNPETVENIGHANDPLPIVWLWVPLGIFSLFMSLGLLIGGFNTVIILTTIIAVICTFHAALRILACWAPKPKAPQMPDVIEWPFYTVLIPLYHEAHMIEGLMKGLSKIQYPREKLEIFIICEEVDPFTIAMVDKYLKPPFELIIVPKGSPQTKPRALNYAMGRAKGDIITIFDAEDIPHPEQLKRAARTFLHSEDIGAIQAPLDYRNSNYNWLTRQFSLEYSALFHVWLPFLVSSHLPFPLGGTSNHVRRTALDAVGGWDSYNVTEDADLSFRLAALGWKFGFIDCATDEEAVMSWTSWCLQRSRWMKGFIQTWVVHMQIPFAPRGWAGFKRFYILQLTIGLTLLNAFFHLPIVIIMILILAKQILSSGPIYIPIPFIVSLILSYLAGISIGIIGAIRAGKPKLILSAIWMPIYWLDLFFPTLHALWELAHRPFFWHKTHHGVRARLNKPHNIDSNSNYDAFG